MFHVEQFIFMRTICLVFEDCARLNPEGFSGLTCLPVFHVEQSDLDDPDFHAAVLTAFFVAVVFG
jgi:hypothetical protein